MFSTKKLLHAQKNLVWNLGSVREVFRFHALPDRAFPAATGWKAAPRRAHGCLATVSNPGHPAV